MAAQWAWHSGGIGGSGDDNGSLGWSAESTFAIDPGWNLQRVIFSATDQASIATAAGGTDYYATVGIMTVSIGIIRGSQKETPAYVGHWPCVPYQVQASRINVSQFWSAVMSTPEMHADFSFRRSAGGGIPNELLLYCDLHYSVTGPFFTQGGMANMRHSTTGTIRYLVSRPS